MDIRVYPGKLCGTVQAPPSKSIMHRAIICGKLSGHCEIPNLELLEDTQATMEGMKALYLDDVEVHCKESASTLRFLIPVMAALGRKVTFTAGPRLKERPITPLLDLMQEHGIKVTYGVEEGGFPITIEGRLAGDKFAVPGDVSSQFICGLLLAMPLLGRSTDIIFTTPLVSKDYINLTISVMKDFGVNVYYTGTGWHIPGKQGYVPCTYWVEGDYTTAAYFLCADFLPRCNVRVLGLTEGSRQADQVVPTMVPALGHGLEVDVKDIPDSLPILAIMATYAQGKSTFFNAGRLRRKEMDRLTALMHCIQQLGGEAVVVGDRLEIYGGKKLEGGVTVSSYGDHRIAMAVAIGALGCAKPVVITEAESVTKSYPRFYKEFKKLGGVADVIRE